MLNQKRVVARSRYVPKSFNNLHLFVLIKFKHVSNARLRVPIQLVEYIYKKYMCYTQKNTLPIRRHGECKTKISRSKVHTPIVEIKKGDFTIFIRFCFFSGNDYESVWPCIWPRKFYFLTSADGDIDRNDIVLPIFT